MMLKRTAAVAIFGIILVLITGCSTYRVVPPPVPEDPKPVFLLDLGDHSSLVLPWKGSVVRYDYGDWDWYVLGKQGSAQGGKALFGPSPAGLGRSILPGPAEEEAVRSQVNTVIEKIMVIQAEALRVENLAADLNEIFENNRMSKQYSSLSGLEFVRHPQPYTLEHNSNTVVASWLEELGCTVTGGGLVSRWKILQKSQQSENQQ